jgi:acyl-coenzyme A thioesterase PaaI-like protein
MVPEPQDPDFRPRVKASFSRQAFMVTIGASLELVEPGEVHIALPFSTHLSQQHGYLHAGATTAIADSANGYAALTLAPADAEVLAVEFKINLMARHRRADFSPAEESSGPVVAFRFALPTSSP